MCGFPWKSNFNFERFDEVNLRNFRATNPDSDIYVIQYATNSNEENGRPKYLQNYDERLDMGKHSFILVITIYFIHFSLSIAVLK